MTIASSGRSLPQAQRLRSRGDDPERDEAVSRAVNFAILKAHRLGEPRVLELAEWQLGSLRRAGDPTDFGGGPSLTYRGLRVTERPGSHGRVLAWDRARETEMVQAIEWPNLSALRRGSQS